MECGLDCLKIEKIVRYLGREDDLSLYEIEELLEPAGIKIGCHGHTWEADHIKSLIEGGPNIMTNMRTLCMADHRRSTKEMRRRRACGPVAIKGKRKQQVADAQHLLFEEAVTA